MPTALLAEVALRASLGPSIRPIFTYLVPPHLHALVRPGQLVWAPLQRRRVQGVVLRLFSATSPDQRLRELAELGDPEAILTPTGLVLAEWLATTYRVPLYDGLALLLPPGTSQATETTWRATQAGLEAELGGLPAAERAVLYYLRQHGEQDERALCAALRGSDATLRAIFHALTERGLAERGFAVAHPAARPRLVRFVRLAVPTAEVPAILETLARAPRQQAILGWLAARETAAAVPLSALYTATGANAALVRELARRGWLAFEQREVRRDPLAGDDVPLDQPPVLTNDQREAYAAIAAALEGGATTRQVFLLHGITGSGKTEIYLRALARTMRLGHQALVLVPEIALTTQLVRRFTARFPGRLAVLHSGLSMGERYDEWRRLRRGEAHIAIGSRSAVFAPLPDLGLVIVDEEHELTYKNDGSPHYHARDVALQLAELTGSSVILGSATPSVATYERAMRHVYHLLALPERVGGSNRVDGLPRSMLLPLPPVRLVDMRHELAGGNRSIFSHPLQQALATTLGAGEQSILFLNRRGAASFVMCRDCGHVIKCGVCSGPMTVHYAAEEAPVLQANQPEVLVCHSCGARSLRPYVCPQCLSLRVRSFGVGTQRVAEEVLRLLPTARVLRWDHDTARGKGAHGRMLDAMLQRKIDVLVGTQMIAKGLDLPLVSLVGVVAADTGLHLPDFRSGERAFQLLTQVAGRAGRRTAGAQVLIQTYNPEHYALLAAQEHDYQSFYTQEIAYRRTTGYPPFSRLVRFVYAAPSEAVARREAVRLAAQIEAQIERDHHTDWSLVGPAPAFIQRARGQWRWHLILRLPAATPPATLAGFLAALEPLPGWSVDVDPTHVL